MRYIRSVVLFYGDFVCVFAMIGCCMAGWDLLHAARVTKVEVVGWMGITGTQTQPMGVGPWEDILLACRMTNNVLFENIEEKRNETKRRKEN